MKTTIWQLTIISQKKSAALRSCLSTWTSDIGILSRPASRSSCPPAYDIVPLDDGSHSHAQIVVLRALLHSNHSAQRTHKHFCAVSYFCRQGQRDIQFGACLQVLVDHKIQPPS